MMTPANPAELIGKMVRDEWGRQVGMVVSLLADDRGDMAWLLVRMGDGRVRRYRLSDVLLAGSEVVVRSSLKKRVSSLRRRLALLKHEEALLFGLKEGVGSDAIEEMNRDLDRSLSLLEAEARYLLKKIGDACDRCVEQIRDIQRGMACLEVEHEMGNVPDEVYRASMKIMMADLKKLVAERDGLLEAKRELLAMLEGERQAGPSPGDGERKGGPINVEVEGDAEALAA